MRPKSAVLANRIHRAALQRFTTKALLFGVGGLVEDDDISLGRNTTEIVRRDVAADFAINTTAIYIKRAGDVFCQAKRQVGHKKILSSGRFWIPPFEFGDALAQFFVICSHPEQVFVEQARQTMRAFGIFACAG